MSSEVLERWFWLRFAGMPGAAPGSVRPSGAAASRTRPRRHHFLVTERRPGAGEDAAKRASGRRGGLEGRSQRPEGEIWGKWGRNAADLVGTRQVRFSRLRLDAKQEMQKMLARHKPLVLRVNRLGGDAPAEVRSRLGAVNRAWSGACALLQQWDTSLSKALANCKVRNRLKD